MSHSWTLLPATGGPSARSYHTAVWTGSEMIVWGGYSNQASYNYKDNGGRYHPASNSWTDLPNTLANAPSARYNHSAVWTGSEMIVWGGYGTGSSYKNDGGRYNPASDTWTAIPNTLPNTPSGRCLHTAVWTGSEMIVWGGTADSMEGLNTGGRYNPTSHSWNAVATAGAPSTRFLHTAVWTGSQMIVWGGEDFGPSYYGSGGRYDPAANTWAAITATGAPGPREMHQAVWTGSEMIVWGGYTGYSYENTGGRYNPAANSWLATSTSGAPSARSGHTAVWTGSEMIVWAGSGSGNYLNGGSRYHPITDSWTALTVTGTPPARSSHTAVWTGSEMIVWGGYGGTYLDDTFSLTPQHVMYLYQRP
jgi:N-acetylneuraminic acid mutarotase